MRELIKDLARRATVILSTHILQEVQAICDRVIIINRAMTMRMWSEERRAGTFEFLMTTPVQPLHLVLGKFLACIADAASAADGIAGGQQLLGAMMEGQFTSFFAGKPSPLAKDGVVAEAKDKEAETGDAAANAASQASADNKTAGRRDAKDATDQKPSVTSVIERSPESARIILVSSDSFLSDEVLELASSIDRTQYLAPVSFAQNLIDWSLEDRGLLALRSRGGQFSRTLVPMEAGTQMLWEYVSYALALLGLGIVFSFTATC